MHLAGIADNYIVYLHDCGYPGSAFHCWLLLGENVIVHIGVLDLSDWLGDARALEKR